MKNIKITLVLILSLLALPLWAAQAQAPAVTLHLASADTTGFPAVGVRLSAWGDDGLPLADLEAEDFTLQEDGGAPFHPAALRADPDAPLRVALVLDISGSMAGEPLADAQAAAARFLDRLTASDRAALVAFSTEVDPDPASLDPARELPFSGDLGPMYDLVEGLNAGGETHLYNAAAKAVRLFGDEDTGHRALLLLTDGRNEPAGVGDPGLPIALAQEANIPVFIIGLGNDIDEPYLRQLAFETGGLFRAAPRSSELARLFDDMGTLLKMQYQLSYETTLPANGQTHTLDITLKAAGSAAVAGIEIGPFPSESPATATPVPAPTSTALPPTATPVPPTALPAPTEALVAAPSAKPTPPAGSPWSQSVGWAITAVLAVALGLWFFAWKFRSKDPAEVCAQCGRDMTGEPGACPVCGSAKRLEKFGR